MTGTPSPAKPAAPAKPPSNQGSPTRSRSRSPARPASPSKDAPAAADSAPVAHPPSPKNKTPSPARPSSSPKPAVANGSSPAKEPASPVSKSLSLDHPAAAAASADVDTVAGVAGGDEATPAATEGKTSKRPRAAAAANGSTPATASRRASTAGARKSTGGRKSTAAASLVRKESYAIGDVVFAHVKGHPWWPARIVDDKDVPEKFLKERRATKEHCVMFYNSGQFGFVTDEYLVPLEPNHESLGTSAAIKKGIKEALEEPDSLYEILENYKRTDVHDEIADDDDDEHDRRASSSKSSSRKSASGKTPAKKAAKSAESTPARKRRAAAGDDDEVDGKKSKKSKGEATPSRSSKRKAGVAPTPTQDTLMRWRHLLQKTFIKDKQIGDKPRVSAETIHTVDWDGVKTTLDEFFEYVNGPEYSTEAVASTKLHKVVRLIANSSAVTDPDALLVEHDVPNKVNRLFEALRTRSEGSGNASGADAMDTAE